MRAPAAGAVLRKLYDRDVGRRGDAVLTVRAADPYDAAAVADAVVVAVSCADAADLPPPPLVEVTRPPPSARDDDCVQWYAPSEPRWRRRRAIALRRLAASPRFCELFNVLLCHLPSAVRARCHEYQASPESGDPLLPVSPRLPSTPAPRGDRGPGRGAPGPFANQKNRRPCERGRPALCANVLDEFVRALLPRSTTRRAGRPVGSTPLRVRTAFFKAVMFPLHLISPSRVSFPLLPSAHKEL